MASPLCLRCLRRSLKSLDASRPPGLPQSALFSTKSSFLAKPAPPKKTVLAKPGTRATKTLRLSKKSPPKATARPPAPGERKAVRKRIVLSNTNALEVKGLQDLTGDKLVQHTAGSVTLDSSRGHVLGFNNETVDALRALEAFRPTQGWSLFRRPASLIRAETTTIANDLASVTLESKDVVRKIIFGEKGSGKSALLLQAQAMAFLKDWIVVNFPEGQDLTNAQTAYQPLSTPDGTIYVQPQYTAKLLLNLANANQALLSTMKVTKQHQLPTPVPSNTSLSRLAEMGSRDADLAWPIWQALWSELTTPSDESVDGLKRPPISISLDGVDQVMRMSAYLDAEAKSIHAHDLALVRHFVGYLSGQSALPNGGAVVAATCASNRAASPTLDHFLKDTHAKQYNAQLEAETTNPSGMSTKPIRTPEWDPYAIKDSRVESALDGVGVVKLEGLSKEEARGVMEYYAHSGMLREAVTDGLVSEKWTMAGSGIIGELEKGAVRARF